MIYDWLVPLGVAMSVVVVTGVFSALVWFIRLEANVKRHADQIQEIRDQLREIKRIMEDHADTDTARILRLHQKVDESREDISKIAQDVARISGYISRQGIPREI